MQRIPSSNNQAGYNVSQSAINPVAYQNPLGNTLYDNLYASANPWARLIAGSGNRYGDPRITGANLPGGMSGAQFFGTAGGFDGIEKGMTGKIGDQTWRVTGKEKFKEGSIWKGNRRKGVRYNIDWGTEGAMNPTTQTNTNTAPQIGTNNNSSTPYSGYVDQNGISAAPAGTEMTTDANGNQIAISPDEAARRRNAWQNTGTQVPGAVSFGPTNQPSSTVQNNTQQPQNNPVTTTSVNNGFGPNWQLPGQTPEEAQAAMDEINAMANQKLVSPGQSDVINPAADVNAIDKNAVTVTNQTAAGFKGVDAEGALIENEYKRNRFDRRNDRQMRREERRADEPIQTNLTVSNQTPNASVNPDIASSNTGPASPTKQEIRQERRDARQERRDNRQEMFSNIKGLFSGKRYDDGGMVDPNDLANAIALINRAFGGMIPKANNGLDLGSEDTDANKIPDYLQAENLPANKPNPFTNKSTLEASEGKKFNVNWDAAADVYATSGAKFANFMDKVSSFQGNQERELAKRSALNRPSDTYDTMDQGMYDQWGNAKPNDLNNQVLNPTDVYRQNQRQVYAYGGRLYEMGGQVDLDDSELEALRMAGFTFRRS
jgi:hypothetical protein